MKCTQTLSPDFLTQEQDHILALTSKLLSKNIKKYNAINGGSIEQGNSYEDLGDYLPELILGNNATQAHNEIEATILHLKQHNFVFKKTSNDITRYFSRSYDQSDLIYGLFIASLWEQKYQSIFNTSLCAWIDNFYRKKPTLMFIPCNSRLSVWNIFGKFANINILSALDHGMFIELLALGNNDSHNFLEQANNILNDFLNTNTYKRYGFFPFYTPTNFASKVICKRIKKFSKRHHEFQLLKENSNIMFGILALHKACKQPEQKEHYIKIFEQTLDSWFDQFYQESTGVFQTNYNFDSGKIGADLTCFHLLDIVSEYTLQTNSHKYISKAKNIADSFLYHQHPESGLLPFFHPNSEQHLKRMKLPKNTSWLDSEVDFAVSLCRLAAISDNKKYYDAANDIAHGIAKHHKLKNGYACSVDCSNGKIIDPTYSTKMTALISKIYFALALKQKINDISPLTYFTLQDR